MKMVGYGIKNEGFKILSWRWVDRDALTCSWQKAVGSWQYLYAFANCLLPTEIQLFIKYSLLIKI